ncbi:hypothetical protein J9253_06220 [Thiothrix litoralis]|uniref:Uncharacterized protein n=1 Tax=Thiothrix litoralis TaxID=2891210 RepID=A0ABX7WVG5_9GAMM|nr:hypothetical protein [Thiothrix litoralis]QTR47527.1 hypothetical protein J9253_06220 [Thiothrix litoralis]
MIGKGFLWNIIFWVSLSGVVPVAAAETADDIATMLTWWDEVGSDWEKAEAFIEFAGTDKEYQLASNTVESSDEQQQQ